MGTEARVERLPMFLLTGFLGSGKTTLLRRFLDDASFADTAVLVNEFGEVGLDHRLLLHSSDRTIVLPGGCVCCAVREDLEVALGALLRQAERGELPPFRRVVIETSGLADPAPVVGTLLSNPAIAQRLELKSVIATVDAVLGVGTLRQHPEATKQIALADTVVITKGDLATDDPSALRAMLDRINPWLTIRQTGSDAPLPDGLFVEGRFHPFGGSHPVTDWVRGAQGRTPRIGDSVTTGLHDDGTGCDSISLVEEVPIDWTAFGIWLTWLLHRHGDKVLRVKGLLDVAGLNGPLVLHAVQHLVHPPWHLEAWPDADRRSHLVFITRGLDPALLRRSLDAFGGFWRSQVPTSNARPANRPAGAGGMVGGRPIRRATAPKWMRG